MAIQIVPDLSAAKLRQELTEPYMTAMFQRMAKRMVEAVENDSSILLPRSAESGQKTISNWFSAYHDRFVVIMLELFREEMPGLFPQYENSLKAFLIEHLWLTAKPELFVYVLRRMAIRWAARQYTDATLVMPPERQSYGWRLPLRITGREQELGQVALDDEGNIIRDKTTPRERYKEKLLEAV